MTLSLDVYWSFRSPYSYLATPRLVTIAEEYDVDLRIRPVYPLAVCVDGFFKKQNPLWLPYVARDALRIARTGRRGSGPRASLY